MFGKTGSVISKTISDIKNIAFISRLVFYIFGIIIPIYNILVFRGWLLLHIVSLCVSVVMLTLFLIYNDTNDKQQRKAIKAKRKSLRKIKKWVRRVNNLYILLCTVYAICVVNTEISLISLFLTVIALISLAISILFDVVRMIIESRIKAIKEAFKEDLNDINPVNRAANVIRKIRGEQSSVKSRCPGKDDIIIDDYTDESFTSRK